MRHQEGEARNEEGATKGLMISELVRRELIQSINLPREGPAPSSGSTESPDIAVQGEQLKRPKGHTDM